MTRRHLNIKTELQGVRFVQAVVQDNHSIVQSFSRENDQGNDCYIEFVKDGMATNYGVFIQIKSGNSYKDKAGYKITADQAHLNYWSQALNLTIGIVYDHELKKALWVDITSYLLDNPHVLRQRYHTIRVEQSNEFSEAAFPEFMEYCISFREAYANYEKYGHALEWFADVGNPEICGEGLKSIYLNHREKTSTWFYIISNFSRIEHEIIRRNILGLISNYVNPDIFWHRDNMLYYPSQQAYGHISVLINKYFGKKEVELVLPYMEQGITRGSFSYLVFLVIDMIKDLHYILKDIAFHSELDSHRRNFCFWLYMHVAKFHSIEETLKTTEIYLSRFPSAENDEAIIGGKESIESGELWRVG
ncbi:MAG: DUF4365 domain-containing protein [Bacteroidetes bacterium]|nr:DUF4365 domain-containing protein [Bacteroidota bacterium]